MSQTELPTFVIGDVHGHVDRLRALLLKADVANQECLVVQLGDLGHFGHDTQAGDLECWDAARNGLIDLVLWGNHDRAVVSHKHTFGGYVAPGPEVKHIMRRMESEGRLKMAEEAHGWLITHAGLHAEAKYLRKYLGEEVDRTDARALAEWLNTKADGPIIDAIGRSRGGSHHYGGILWRDFGEKLWDGTRQIFGHSASQFHIVRGVPDRWYDIDIGGRGGKNDPDADCLAGIWLPSQEIVRIDLNKEKS